MTQIQIDSTAKRIHIELELKGETSPIQIDVQSYELTTKAGETHIKIGEINTSREWINLLINDYLPADKKDIVVPGAMKALL